MADKITLDRDTFKALAADTRIDILKRIGAHKLTLTDLAGQMGMSPSTIKEHLDRLVEVGLIEPDDRGMKWKYYRVTAKGRNILTPQETKVWILLGTTLLILAGSVLSLSLQLMGEVASKSTVLAAAPQMAEGAGGAAGAPTEDTGQEGGEPHLMLGEAAKSAGKEAVLAAEAPTTTTVAEEPRNYAAEKTQVTFPYLQIALIIVSAAVAMLCIIRLMRKKARL